MRVGVSESVIGDLDVLDILELFQSTVYAAEALGISQSSCSRRYRSFSEQFDLGFDRVDGVYRPTRNFDMLAALRQAAQKRRVRQGSFRYGIGWQMEGLMDGLSKGRIDGQAKDVAGDRLSVRTMDSWRVLSMLENRLIDYWIGGLLDYGSMLDQPLQRLRFERVQVTGAVMAVPLCRFDLQLVSHQTHPLRGQKTITADQVALYPSPALDVGMAPSLMGQLQERSLATTPSGLRDHEWTRWQAAAADGIALSYSPPHDLSRLKADGIESLPYNLGITEVGAVLGHRDAIEDGCFHTHLKAMAKLFRKSSAAAHPGLRWLC
jgi:DNA-binding transcriptional LysR family regulator